MKNLKIIGFALILLLCWSGKSFFISNPVQFGKFSVKFPLKDGMLDGLYCSYYSDGKKRAEGHFACNQRIGIWSVWDSVGKLLVKREYKNDFEYKQLFPITNSPVIITTPYSLVRDETGLYSYFKFSQEDVVCSKRVWRTLGKDDESSFFGNDLFYHALIDSIVKGKICIYDNNSDNLQTKINGEDLRKLKDTISMEIIGFKIKEDWFFDKQRKTSEKRIVAICPVICKKDNVRLVDDDFSFAIGWIYFPEIRNTLGAIKNTNTNNVANIITLDDYFFFRCFPSEIYKETNVKNQELKEYCISVDKLINEQQRIEIEMIEMEHDLWIKFSK